MDFLPNLINAGWVVWFLIIALIIFILWLFVGGGNYEYVGLAPMRVGVDSTKYIDDQMYGAIERGNYHAKKVSGINITPKLPQSVNNLVNNNSSIFVPSSVGTSGNNNNNTSLNLIPLIPLKPVPPYDPSKVPVKKPKKCSKGEQMCRQVVEEIYNKPFPCVRPNFLKNPETKRNLELDCYNEGLKIAVERNGIQHYVWPNFTGQSKEEFIKQLRRDKFKIEICDRNGIYLITVPYTVEIKDIEKYIRYYLPENYHQRLENEKNPNQIYEDISETYDLSEWDPIEYSDEYSQCSDGESEDISEVESYEVSYVNDSY